MPSEFYQHKSNDLWSQYQSGLIDHKKYSEMLAAIKDEEINKEIKETVTGVPVRNRDAITNDIWNYEHKLQEARAKAERLKNLPPLEGYKEEIPETITRYRNDANSYRRSANFFQLVVIVGSVLATSVTSALGFWLGDEFKWVAPVISIVVIYAISARVTSYFKLKERSFNLQQTADAIEEEYIAVDLGTGYYRGKHPQEALELFAERVELLKDEQKKREQQLEHRAI